MKPLLITFSFQTVTQQTLEGREKSSRTHQGKSKQENTHLIFCHVHMKYNVLMTRGLQGWVAGCSLNCFSGSDRLFIFFVFLFFFRTKTDQ